MMIHPTYIVKSDKLENGIARWFDWTKNIVSDIESDLDYEDYETLGRIIVKIKQENATKRDTFMDFLFS